MITGISCNKISENKASYNVKVYSKNKNLVLFLGRMKWN